MGPGTIVRCRNRYWVMLPSEDEHLALLRPLTGATDEVVAVYRPLADAIGYKLSSEQIESSLFPPCIV